MPLWPVALSGRLSVVALVGCYPAYYLMGREPLPKRFSLTPSSCDIVVLCGISTCFQVLSPSLGQVIHVLLTRAPLR